MRRFLIVVAVLIVATLIVPFKGVVFAESGDLSAQNEYESIIKEGDLLRFYDRTAGTDGERQFALYLEGRMIEMGYLPNGSDADNKSFEKFSFISKIDGLEHQSQNLRFLKKADDSTRRIIICTSYDNAFGFYANENSFVAIGEDAGLSGVVCTLEIAKRLAIESFEFDIEFVFFGAEYHDFAGGNQFALGISDKDAENILLAINIDDLSDGELFYYDAEKITSYGKAFSEFASGKLEIEKYSAGSSVVLENSGVYPFTHRALMSDNAALMESGVRCISLLSAQKTGVFGNEYYREYGKDRFDGEEIPKSIDIAASLAQTVSEFVMQADFERISTGNAKISAFWTNENFSFVALVTFVALAWVAFYLVYWKLFWRMKQKFTTKQATESIEKMIDDEIDKSNNIDVKRNRNQIKQMFSEEIKKRIDKDDSKEE